MKLSYDKIMNKANEIYALQKLKESGLDPMYTAPEVIESYKIRSSQVKSVLKA